MNKLWLLFGVLLAPLSLVAVLLQVATTGLGLIALASALACFAPLVAFYGLGMKKVYFNKLFWRIAMWLIAIGFLKFFIMPFLYMTFGYPEVNAGDQDGMYEIYIASGVFSIFSLLICFGLYKYSEFVGSNHT